MKGHIRERSPGKWAIVLDIRDPATGKRKRKWHSFTGTKREAQIECARFVSAMAGGTYQKPAKTTVAQYLERWVAHMSSQVAPRTHERYAELALKNIMPLLGAVPLTRLRPEQISAAYTKALTSGRRDGQAGYPRERCTICTGCCAKRYSRPSAGSCSPATRPTVKPPKVEREAERTLRRSSGTVALIEAARGTRHVVPILLGVALRTAPRRGSGAALALGLISMPEQLAVVASTREQTGAGGPGEGDQER